MGYFYWLAGNLFIRYYKTYLGYNTYLLPADPIWTYVGIITYTVKDW